MNRTSSTARALRRPHAVVAILASCATAVVLSPSPPAGATQAGDSASPAAPAAPVASAGAADAARGRTQVLPAARLGPGSPIERVPVLALPALAKDTDRVGTHYVWNLPVYWTATKPTVSVTGSGHDAAANAGTYWRAASAGQLDVVFGGDTDWQHIDLSPAEVASCDKAAIWREVTKLVRTGNDRDHVFVNLQPTPTCDWTDLEWLGATDRGFGLTYTNGMYVPDQAVISRAVIHNAGVPSAGSLDCVDATGNPVPLSATCTYRDYTDPYDPASDQPYGRSAMPLATSLFGLGVLENYAQYLIWTITDTPVSGDFHLATLSATRSTFKRGLTMVLDGVAYQFEYRVAQPGSLDAWIDDRSYLDAAGRRRTDPGGELIMHRTVLSDPTGARALVDFHPERRVALDTERHPGLGVGERYTAPDALFVIEVTAADADEVAFDLTFPWTTQVSRISGDDRYQTAELISEAFFPPGYPAAYVASGDVFTDALSGAPVAGTTLGPVVLTKRDEATTYGGIRQPGSLVILGGPASVSDAVMATLAGATKVATTRWSGADRFETSATISAHAFAPGVDTVYVASGRVFPDALSGAAVAGRDKAPVLLVDTTAIPPSIARELRRLAPRRIVILGGPASVSPQVEATLGAYAATVERWSGADRFATSAAISRQAFRPGVDAVLIASGRVFSDALPGAAAAAKYRYPVLLVDQSDIPSDIRAELARLRPKAIVVLGGPNTITYGVQAQLARYVNP